jgi:hypothetical protein
VWEWCSDWYADKYRSDDRLDPLGAQSGSDRFGPGAQGRGLAQRRQALPVREPPQGRPVVLKDQTIELARSGMKRIEALTSEAVEKGVLFFTRTVMRSCKL